MIYTSADEAGVLENLVMVVGQVVKHKEDVEGVEKYLGSEGAE